MQGRRGRHRARRPRLETLARAAVALTLCAPLATITSTPASAGTTLAVDLLGDLAPDVYLPDSYVGEAPVVAGSDFYFTAYGGYEEIGLYRTDGQPGSWDQVVLPVTQFSCGGNLPGDLTPLGDDGTLLFQACAGQGNNGDQRRLFVTGGSGDTCPIQPGGACDVSLVSGYYGICPDLSLCDRRSGSTMTATATKGVVLAAGLVDLPDDTWESYVNAYHDYLPHRFTRDQSGTLVVTDLVRGFAYDGPRGFPFDPWTNNDPAVHVPIRMVGDLVTTVGDTVYADLYDCDPTAVAGDSVCSEGDAGLELYRLDLSSDANQWQLVADLSPGAASTTFGRALGVVGTALFLEAKPDGAATFGIYRSDGTSLTEVTPPTDPRFAVGDGFAWGDDAAVTDAESVSAGGYLYFAPRNAPFQLWRVGAGQAALVTACSADVVIVGGGFTGLWTAYSLLRRNPARTVVVLEAHTVGAGASGRNGGWCSALLPMGLDAIAAASSRSDAVRFQRVMFDTVDEVARVVETEQIGCGFHKGGTIELARSELQWRRAQAHVEHLEEYGLDHVRLLGPDEVTAMMRALPLWCSSAVSLTTSNL